MASHQPDPTHRVYEDAQLSSDALAARARAAIVRYAERKHISPAEAEHLLLNCGCVN